MKKTKKIIILCASWFAIISSGALANSERFFHAYWSPQYHGKPLAYCLSDRSACGQVVADRYCRELGYDEAQRLTIAHNLGETSYLDKDKCCIGWKCAGFKVIKCSARTLHQPRQAYYYRTKEFVMPRFNHYRVDWCYENGHKCGKRPAFSFCRRMGYARASNFKLDKSVAATRELGNQRLCFGKNCQGFSSITCYR